MHVCLSSMLGALYSGMDIKCPSKTHVSKAWYPVQHCPEALGNQSHHEGSYSINRFNTLLISKLKGLWGDSGIIGNGGECFLLLLPLSLFHQPISSTLSFSPFLSLLFLRSLCHMMFHLHYIIQKQWILGDWGNQGVKPLELWAQTNFSSFSFATRRYFVVSVCWPTYLIL